MKCKFCGAEWEAEGSFCPQCGKNNAEEEAAETTEVVAEEVTEETAEQPGKKGWKIAVAVIACLAVLAAAAAGIWYLVNDGWTPRENDVYYKDSYTVTDEKAPQKADRVVATYAGEELTNGELQVYYWMQFYDFLNYFGDYIGYYIDLDYTKPLDTQVFTQAEGEDGQATTWQQYFLGVALDAWKRDVTMEKLAKGEDYKLSAEFQTIVDNLAADLQTTATDAGYESADQLVKSDFGAAADLAAYEAYMTRYYYGNEWLVAWKDAQDPSKADIEKYFDENAEEFAENGITKDSGPVVDVRHILIMPEGDGSTDDLGYPVYAEDAWAAAKVEVDAIYDQWKQGAMTEDSFAQLAKEKSEDGSASVGGLYEDVMKGDMVENFENWILDASRKKGDHDLIQTQFGYHIMYFVDSTEGWYAFGLEQYLYDKGNEMLEAEMEKNPMEVDYRRIALAEAKFN